MDAGRRVVSPTLVGRESELDRLVRAVLAPPAVVLVEGESGVGKTRLVTELADRPELAGRLRLRGSCLRIREPFPLGPVVEAVRGLDAELIAAGLSPVTGALRPLLPELAEALPPALPPLDDRAAERHRVFRALAELLAVLGPAVLVLEDLHWAEEQTVDFLRYLLAGPPSGLALVLTLRAEGIAPDIRGLVAAPPPPVARHHLPLGTLGVPATGALAAAILERDQVSEELAELLWHRTAGLPLALEELLALLRSRGELPYPGAVGPMLDRLDVPTGIRDQVWQRVNGLSAPAREVVEAAAVLQRAVPAPVLLATSRPGDRAEPDPDRDRGPDHGPGEPGRESGEPGPGSGESGLAEAGLAEALAAGVLVESPAGVGFRHLLAAQAVYEALPGPLRRNLHWRATRALAAQPDPPLGQLAHHYKQAGDVRAWVASAERAAEAALAVGHDGEAVRLLEEVLRTASLPADHRGRLAVTLSRAAIQTRHHDGDITGLLATVLREELPRAVRGELRLRMAMLLEWRGGDFREQRALYAEAAGDLEELPEVRVQAMLGLGFPFIPGITLSECRGWLARVRATLPHLEPGFRALLVGKLAAVLVAIGDPDWRALVDQLRTITGGVPDCRPGANGYGSAGLGACYAGHLAAAQPLLAAALAAAEDSGSGHLAARTRASLAVYDYCRGEWDGLADRVAVLTDQLADYAPSHIDLVALAGCLALARGDHAHAARLLPAATRALVRRGGYDMLPMPAAARIRLALGRGRPDVALTTARRFLAAMDGVPPMVTIAWALPAVAEAWCAGGDRATAAAVVARCARELAELDAPLVPAARRHARGVLAAAASRWQPAARHFTAAAERYQVLDSRYQAAQAWEQAALALGAAGKPLPAGSALRAAVNTYEELGASWDHSRAAGAARQRGIPVPARHRGGHRGYPTDLSPREREVAELAATGRTNKDIGAELFVSANTVKKQLAAAMRKLGVRSRAELAYRLATGQNPAHRSG